MSTLLIRLIGPQQSWGSRSRFATRGTELAPTKSGVIGMVASALGLDRTASLERFEALRFGVRIDQPGRVERDFHTARTLDGSTSMPLSDRFFLSDAVFVAGLESADDELLLGFDRAMAAPVYPPFLGRRAFPPAGPVRTFLVPAPLEQALSELPWHATERYQKATREPSVRLEVRVDAVAGDTSGDTIRDVPVSYDPRRREYGWRDVRELWVELPNPAFTPDLASSFKDSDDPHDPMSLVSEAI